MELCNRLVKMNTEKLKQVESIESRVNEMMKLSFGNDATQNQRDKHIKVG
jgi:hypothetical protein